MSDVYLIYVHYNYNIIWFLSYNTFFIYSKQLFFSIECCINLEINYFQYIFALSDIIKHKELRTLIIYSKSVNDDLNAN